MNISYFMLSPGGALYMGLCLMLGVMSGVISLGLYSVFRHKSLLYFGIVSLSSYIIFSAINSDPSDLNDLPNNPVMLRIVHVIVGFSSYFYYKLALSTFTGKKLPTVWSTLFKFTLAASLVTRLLNIIFLNEVSITITSLFVSFFLIAGVLLELSRPISGKKAWLLRTSNCFFCLGFLPLPLIRSGLFTNPVFLEYVRDYGPFYSYILLGGLSVFTFLWLIGLAIMTKDLYDQAQRKAIQDMATAFIQLRDLMNTPLQIIDLSVELMHNSEKTNNKSLGRMKSALSDLKKINKALAPFEKDVDWSRKNKFFEI